MASKRERDEAETTEEMNEGEELKRQKSYNQILSLLDEEEEEAIQDLSSIITTLQQEISSPSPTQNNNNNTTATDSASLQDFTNFASTSSSSATSPEEGESDRVMRHLLQASDDELGIPNGEFLAGEGLDGVPFCDGLWELEDEAANYYTLFQSQFFM